MSSSRSDSSQKTATSTTSTAYNQQVGASEGSIAVGGAGNTAHVTIQQVDADVVREASEGITAVAGRALEEQGATTRTSLQFGADAIDSALDFGVSALQFGAGRSDAAISLADASARRSAELSDSLRATLGDAAKAPEERITTSLLAFGALGAVGFFIWKASK